MSTPSKINDFPEHILSPISTSSHIGTSASENTLKVGESSIERIKDLHEYSIKVCSDAEITIDSCLEKIKKYEAAVTKLNKDSKMLQEGINKCKDEITKRGQLINKQNAEIKKLSQDLKNKQIKVATLESEISALSVQYNVLEGDSRNASNLIETLEKQIEERQNKVAELKEKLSELNSRGVLSNIGAWTIASISGLCKTTDGEIKVVQSEMDKENAEIKKMQQTLADYKRSPKYIVEQELKAKELELTRLEDEIDRNKKELSSKRSEVQQLTLELDDLKSQHEKNNEDLVATSMRLKETEKKLQEAQNDLRKIASRLSDKITGETKEIILGKMSERAQLWQSLPTTILQNKLSIEINLIGNFTGTLEEFLAAVNSLKKEIDTNVNNQKELARMEQLVVDGILSKQVPAFVEISSIKRGKGADVSLMYQFGKNPTSQTNGIDGSIIYCSYQVARNIINKTFDEIQKSHNWTSEKRQEIELKVNDYFYKFLEANPGKSAACYFNELAQIIRLARANGNIHQFSQNAQNELSKLAVVYCVNCGNIDTFFSITIAQALSAINSKQGIFNGITEDQLKNFLVDVKNFCAENNLDYDWYLSNAALSTLVNNEISLVKLRQQEASDTMNRAVSYILSNSIPAFCDIVGNIPNGPFSTAQGQQYNGKVDSWTRFFQIANNYFSDPDEYYKLSPDDVKLLAARMTDVAINQIGQKKMWSPDTINNAKKWVIEKFNGLVNPEGGQQYNVLFNNLAQIIRLACANGNIPQFSQDAQNKLRNLAVVYCVNGGNLNTFFSITIAQALNDINSQQGIFNGIEEDQLKNFLVDVQNFCAENGLNYDKYIASVSFSIFIGGTNFIDTVKFEVTKVNARRQEAIQTANTIAESIFNSFGGPVPIFSNVSYDMSKGQYVDEHGNLINENDKPIIVFGRLIDICENPFDEPRANTADTIDQFVSGHEEGVLRCASLIVDSVYSHINNNDNGTIDSRKKAIIEAFKEFVRLHATNITYSDCLNQLSALIPLENGFIPHLPQSIYSQDVHNELKNVFYLYAAKGGDLDKLYKMPISQMINTLYNSGLFQVPPGCQVLLPNFLGGISSAFNRNEQTAKNFINNTSISDLSMMQ